ncbi:MAG: ThuA domain-containing protein [Planctomycetes bacterium]|nr:ThuA domain-containing protein [Planctomycetota bacterium]
MLLPLMTLSLPALCVPQSQELLVQPKWLVYEGDHKKAPGLGRRVVLMAGDEEYRSEEAQPLLARSLNQLGFETVVLFSQDPETGLIDPDQSSHIPGTHLIDDAVLLVLQLRFRELPDAGMKHIVDFVEAGKPLVGIRTSTHAFRYQNKDSEYAQWDWKSSQWKGGFGKQILGETWIAHHGHHGKEATRGLPHPDQAEHPVLRGVGPAFGRTDVYAAGKLPEDAVVLLQGEVVAGMKPEDPRLEGKKNNPMHPVGWVRERPLEGEQLQRILTITLGSAGDWSDSDLRRFFLNGSMWCLGEENIIPPSGFPAEMVGPWEPTPFGFGKGRLGYFPEDYRKGSPWAKEK